MRLWAVVLGIFAAALPACADVRPVKDVKNVWAPRIVAVSFEGPTQEYPHGVLGDDVEYKILRITAQHSDGARVTQKFSAGPAAVFEDIAPRLWDLDGDGDPEVVVVRSDYSKGASLAVYNGAGLIAQTPPIGQRFRWLAPIGAADFDGDGVVEVAYIDRPHLAKTLRLWRFDDGRLIPVADLAGLTNHRIGEDYISGGVRDCGAGPEMIVANADWSRVMAVRFDGARFLAAPLFAHKGQSSFAAALACAG